MKKFLILLLCFLLFLGLAGCGTEKTAISQDLLDCMGLTRSQACGKLGLREDDFYSGPPSSITPRLEETLGKEMEFWGEPMEAALVFDSVYAPEEGGLITCIAAKGPLPYSGEESLRYVSEMYGDLTEKYGKPVSLTSKVGEKTETYTAEGRDWSEEQLREALEPLLETDPERRPEVSFYYGGLPYNFGSIQCCFSQAEEGLCVSIQVWRSKSPFAVWDDHVKAAEGNGLEP